MPLVSGKIPKSGQSGHVCCKKDGLCLVLSKPPHCHQNKPLASAKFNFQGRQLGVFPLAIISELEAKCLKEPSVSHWIKHEQGCQVKKAGDGVSMEIIQLLSGQFLTFFPCVSAYMLCWSRICAHKFSERFTEALSKGEKVFSMEKVKFMS